MLGKFSSRPLGETSSPTALEGRRQNIVGVQDFEPYHLSINIGGYMVSPEKIDFSLRSK